MRPFAIRPAALRASPQARQGARSSSPRRDDVTLSAPPPPRRPTCTAPAPRAAGGAAGRWERGGRQGPPGRPWAPAAAGSRRRRPRAAPPPPYEGETPLTGQRPARCGAAAPATMGAAVLAAVLPVSGAGGSGPGSGSVLGLGLRFSRGPRLVSAGPHLLPWLLSGIQGCAQTPVSFI